jgi:RimJ/RimL family protein N-acetyltransferase
MSARELAYVIRVDGHLDDHWSAWLGGLDMTRDGDGATTITVEVADQAQLHGVLAGLRDIGATISELRARDDAVPAALERPLRTERLTLRPATADDAGATWKYRPVNEWLTGTAADYRERFCDPARLAATVIVTLGHDPEAPIIGDFMLRREGTHAELGWVLDPTYAGRGYASEAVRELLRHCFRQLGVRRVAASCLLGDDTSWRLMERVGMRREVVGYAVLAEEWEER